VTFAAQILTLYPEMFPGPLGASLAGRALAESKWSCTPIQIRDFATDKHKSVDDTPAGGGAGMVMRADVLAAAVDDVIAAEPAAPILSGGEVAALVLLDACIRLLPGVMGAPLSGDDESFETGLLEYPHYTRPATWEGRTIPQVLRSGDHAKIAAWRQRQAEDDTRLRRPDLWERHIATRVQPASDARRKNKD